MKKFINNYKFEILSFIIPIVLFIIFLFASKMAPLGKNLILVYDGYYQYPGFSSYLSEVLRGDASIFYSFKGALGYNFFACFIYYLSSPINLLLLFFNYQNIDIFYTISIILKIGLCGLTTSILLRYISNNKPFNLILSISYALSAYNITFYANTMWFDSIIMLPLVILGIEKLFKERKRLLYVISLSLVILFNFYIGYMICIFSLLYFIYKFFILDKKDRKFYLIKDFIICSLCAGLISGILLIPVIFELLAGKIDVYANTEFTKYFILDSDFINFFYKLTPGSYLVDDMKYGTQSVYCSLFTIVLIIYYFFNTKYKTKEKLLSLFFILLFPLCFTFNLFDYAWQLFQRPIWYPSRYSFCLILLLVIIASKGANNLSKTIILKKNIKHIIILSILTLTTSFLVCESFMDKLVWIPKIIFVFFSILLIVQYLVMFNNKKLYIFTYILFILELSINSACILQSFSEISTSYFNNMVNNEINSVKLIDDDSFYRMDLVESLSYNSGASLNYNGIKYFSSLRNKNGINFLNNVTLHEVIDNCSVRFNAYNPVTNALLGTKYIVTPTVEEYYEYIGNSYYNVYKNNDAFSLAFMVNEKLKEVNIHNGDSFYNLNSIMNAINNVNNKNFIKLKVNKSINLEIRNSKYHVINEEDESYIKYKIKNSKKGFYVLNSINNEYRVSVKINGKEVGYNKTSIFVEEKDNLEIIMYVNNDLKEEKTDLYFLSYKDYKYFIHETKLNMLDITNYKSDSNLEGIVYVTNDKKTMLTTIPYDTGWKIYVDGNKINYKKELNSFISFDLNQGKHSIKFVYIPNGLLIGSFISGIGIITITIYLYKTKKKK